MDRQPRVFIDTSALFAGIWSEQGGARMMLKLGEAGAIDLVLSAQVLEELEGALRRKAPDALADLAVLLDRARIEIAPEAAPEESALGKSLVARPANARIVAAALTDRPDYFVTLDRQHLLDNVALAQAAPFEVGTPGDFLAWFRAMLDRSLRDASSPPHRFTS